MWLNKNIFTGIFMLLPVVFSCTKETVDPSKYDALIYKTPVTVVEKYNTINATVDGSDWKTSTSGTARVDSATLVVEGSVNGQKLLFTLTDFRKKKSFSFDQSSLDSSSFFKSTDTYSSRNIVASGSLTLSRIDSSNKYVEGNFSFTLVNKEGTTVQIENGYFKITYTENYLQAVVNFENWSSDTLWTVIETNNTSDELDDSFIITARDSIHGKVAEVKLIIPKNFSMGTYTLTTSGKYRAIYSSDIKETATPCNGDIQNKIKVTHNPAAKTLQGTFTFQTKEFDLIEKGKFSATY